MNWTHRFPSLPGETGRRYQGDEILISITPPADLGLTRGELHLNTPSDKAGGVWEFITMEPDGEGGFELILPLLRPGLYSYRFTGSASPKEDRKIWDPVEYTSLLVDPRTTEGLTLYTMIPHVSGYLNTWDKKLRDIAELGFTGVHFLPLSLSGGSNSPYSVADHFALDPRFLDSKSRVNTSAKAMTYLVKTAKKLKLRLCFDLVLNHVATDGKVAWDHPEWILPDNEENDGLQRAGCWHNNSWIKWEDLGKIDFSHPVPSIRGEIWDFFVEYASFWGAAAEETGGFIRFDNLHSSHSGFISHLSQEISARHPQLSVLAEYFDDPKKLKKNVAPWRLNLLIANPWERPFVPQLREYLKELNQEDSPRNLVPLSTHDTKVPAELYGDVKSTIPRYFIGAMMTGGQTGLVQGVEDGVISKIEFIGTDLTMPDHNPGLFHKEIKLINELLRDEKLLHKLGNLIFIDDNHHAVLATLRISEIDDTAILAAANLDIYNSHELSLQKVFEMTSSVNSQWLNLIPGNNPLDEHRLTIKPCGISFYKLQ